MYNCDLYSNWYSLENAWKQVAEFRDYLEAIGKLHPEGIIVLGMCFSSFTVFSPYYTSFFLFLGYSQGGLLARATIQSMPNHNVKVFISLSSPQAGQYGSNVVFFIKNHTKKY